MNAGFIKRSRRECLTDAIVCCITAVIVCWLIYVYMPPRYTWYDCSSFMQTEEDEDGTTIDLLDGIYEYTALHFTFEGTAKGGETVTFSHWSLTELPRCDTLQGKVDADGSVTIEGEFGHDRMLHVDRTGLSGVTIRNRLYPLGAFGIVIYAASAAALYWAAYEYPYRRSYPI